MSSRFSRGVFAAFGVLFGLWLLALTADRVIYSIAPPETLGWGERPSLEPDPDLGWRLIPSSTTRLRWAGYDYVVTSNSMGFPGPELRDSDGPSSFRILTLGGGFTSAEGVDTMQAWPRRLERLLNRGPRESSVEVVNMAVTGYGTKHQSLLVQRYSRELRPATIILTLAPNDLLKAAGEDFDDASSIGFGRPESNSVLAALTCRHLLTLLRQSTDKMVSEHLLQRPYWRSWDWGQFAAFARENRSTLLSGQQEIARHLDASLESAVAAEARVMVLLVPSAIQVCAADQLEYFPRGIDLDDKSLWDLEQPHDLFVEILRNRGVAHHDLREAFEAEPDLCPNFASNMHWTVYGHEMVAASVRDLIAD